MAPTLDYLQGFEHGITGTGLIVAGAEEVWQISNNTAAITSVAGRLAGSALQFAMDGSTATYVMHVLPATQSRVFSGYFKLPNTPGSSHNDNVDILLTSVSNTQNVALFEVHSEGTGGGLRAQMAGGTRRTTSFSVCDGAWHKLDFWTDTSGTTWTLHWSVDEVVQTNATQTGMSAQSADRLHFGSTVAADNITVIWDDGAGSVTSGDYPIAPHQVIGAVPNGDGGSFVPSANIEDNTGTDLSVGNPAWDNINTWPPASTPYIRQSSVGTTNFAEVTFTDTTGSPAIWAVYGYAALWASGGGANNATTRIVDSADATLTDIFSGDQSQTTIRYTSALITAPSGGWDSGFNGVKGRWGFSSNVTTLPRLSGLMLEYVIPTTVIVDASGAVASATASAVVPTNLSEGPTGVTAAATAAGIVPTLKISVNIVAVTATATADAPAHELTNFTPTGVLAYISGSNTFALFGNFTLGNPGITAFTQVVAVTSAATASGIVPVLSIKVTATTAAATADGIVPDILKEGPGAVIAVSTASGIVPAVLVSIDAPTAEASAEGIAATLAIGAGANVVVAVTAEATASGIVPAPTVLLSATTAIATAQAITAAPSTITIGIFLRAQWTPVVRRQARTGDYIYLKGRAVVGLNAPVTKDLFVYVNADKKIFWNISNRDMSDYEDIAGWNLSWDLAATDGGVSVLSSTVTIEDSASGLVSITLVPSDTSTFDPGTYHYELARTDVGHQDVAADGKFVLRARVT